MIDYLTPEAQAKLPQIEDSMLDGVEYNDDARGIGINGTSYIMKYCKYGHDALTEHIYSRFLQNCGIPTGVQGILSYDVAQNRLDNIEGLDISTAIKINGGFTFQKLLPRINLLAQRNFADMIFLDMLLKHMNRHAGNFKILVDRKEAVLDLLPLYDNDLILEEHSAEISKFVWDSEMETYSYQLKKMHKLQPERINELINRAEKLPRTAIAHDFIMQRVGFMREELRTGTSVSRMSSF